MELSTIGVVGAGQMGAGIAQVFVEAGFDVHLNDVSNIQLEAARARIDQNLERQVRKDRISQEARTQTLARLRLCPELPELGASDLIVESATERETTKEEIFKALQPHLGADTVLATNTSSISVTRLAATTDRPERFMGLHFMNPVPVMKLVELIRGIATDQTTFEMLHGLVEKIGKTSTTSEDFPAFIVNRVLIPMINEACYVLFEGIGNVQSIDESMTLGANHPMGPLMLADFIGLDTCLAIMHVLNDGLADTKYRPCPLLVKYVEAGWVGRKCGRGFYDYRGDHPVPTR
ncbi:MAG: 3-hydroxybutyryl-CoA dehydrogenase [Donghicola eburneus]|nr:3-hydroxybutyryl-CoA dehydrogenase [Donghicola eburneus]MCI5042475.1 3-hydroxybutyryl-CoA dehydrogenase [Donghicola eburneus]MEE3071356.1 3-hydroxybutyryl-CoA dehydrogenase [Pseudomonadota bacterium]